jgi:outer membrane protein assembly factor BamB
VRSQPLRRLLTAAFGTTLVLVVACSDNGAGGTTDWATWGFDVERNSFNPEESTIGVDNVDGLEQRWTVDLGAVSNTSPMVALDVDLDGTPTDLAFVGTEHGAFLAIDLAEGRTVWRKQFPTQTLECSESPDNVFGVTAAAVIERDERRVYVAAADGKVHALDLGSGREIEGWPVTVAEDPKTDFVWSAPTLWKDRLYVGTASHCELGPREGRIVAIDTRAAERRHVFWISKEGPPIGGSVWGWGGVSVDPRTDDVYAATGNVKNFPENIEYGDQVVRLTRDLEPVASHAPPVVGFDDDFGSTPVLFRRDGCPPQLVVTRKHGALYLYDRDAITEGPRQTLDLSGEPYRFIGVVAFWPEANLVFVANPTPPPDETYTHGMVAFEVTSECRLKLAWQKTAGRNDSVVSPPVVANGVVYYGDGMGNQVHAFDAREGTRLWSSAPDDLEGPVFAAPVVVDGMLLAAAWDNRLHAWKLP